MNGWTFLVTVLLASAHQLSTWHLFHLLRCHYHWWDAQRVNAALFNFQSEKRETLNLV